jgi:ABC-type amino acid transport substrate-binding protein
MKLIGGRVDLIVIDNQVANYHIKNDFTGYKNYLQPAGSIAWKEDLHIIVSKNHESAENLISIVDQAIEEINL